MSVEKTLKLFERIVSTRGAAPLRDIAADLALPRATLYRLTASLQAAGLITRAGRGRYDAGLPLLERLSGATAAGQMARLGRPVLQALADDCAATAHLGVLENDMVTYRVKCAGKGAAPVFTRENAQLEAYASGVGKVLLAWLPEAERQRYLAAGPFVPLTQRTITAPELLAAELARVRGAQFARDDGEAADGLYCLAVPVLPGTEAISLSFTRAAGREDAAAREDAALLAKLRHASAELAQRFGRAA